MALESAEAIEHGISINLAERNMEYPTKEAERSRAWEYTPNPGISLMHNPFYIKVKKEKKPKKAKKSKS